MKHPLNCRPVGRIHYLQVLSLIALLTAPTAAQTCYYPDGSPSIENDIPCVKGAEGACCPDGWECYTNGLCYLPNEGYFGRYTCTDKTWKSPGCTNLCTHDHTASGNEAILNCNGTNWCCDANRPDAQNPGTGCCDTGVSGLFSLAIGKAGTPTGIGSSSPSSQAASSSTSSQAPSSSSPSSSQAPASSSSSQAPPSSTSQILVVPPSSTSETSSESSSESAAPTSTAAASATTVVLTTSPSTGGVSFVTVTKAATGSSGSSEASSSRITPFPASGTSSSSPTPSSKPNTTNKAVIIGPAVAVPVLLIILAIIGFFLWRNRRNKKRDSAATSVPSNYDDDKSSPNTQGPYIYNAVEADEATGNAGYRGVPLTSNNNTQPYPLSPTSAELEGRAISPSHSELAGSSPTSAHFYHPLSYELPGNHPGVR